MAGPRAIESALDLLRMPKLALSATPPPIPGDIFELIRIAAGSADACADATRHTGLETAKLQEAARFYLQHVLFRPDADSYRILGLEADASRETARRHFKWLLQWLHPDKNSGVESVYSQRVLKAWQEISVGQKLRPQPAPARKRRTRRVDARLRREAILAAAGRNGTQKNQAPKRTRRLVAIVVGLLMLGTILLVFTNHSASVGAYLAQYR